MNRPKKGSTSKVVSLPLLVPTFQLFLDKVVGTTSRHNAAMAINTVTGEIAYAAGSVVVLYDAKSGQSRYLASPKPKSILCLDFSPNGKYLAVGEVI